MQETLKVQPLFERRWQLGWKIGSAVLLVLLFFMGWSFLPKDQGPDHLVVYAFSAEEEVFTQGIFPAFERMWEAETQVDLTIEGVFGPSGTLAGQINLGAPAEIAIFSNLDQVNWLQLGDLVEADAQPVVIGTSPIVIVTRAGNPQNLHIIADLAAPGLNLLHADPRSSGVAEWALLAEYGEALRTTGDSQAAEAQLKAIWRNVRMLAPSARALLTLFELGAGDALLTYEQDALLAQARGVPLEIVIPPQTIVAQPVALIVDGNVKRAERAVAQAFLDFLVSEQGEQIFSQFYLRPADLHPVDLRDGVFAPIEQPFTVDELGGWTAAYTNLVEPLWQQEIAATLALEPIPAYFNPEK